MVFCNISSIESLSPKKIKPKLGDQAKWLEYLVLKIGSKSNIKYSRVKIITRRLEINL